jgi:hypothetical protein
LSHHYSGPDFGFPHGDARLDFCDLYAFPKSLFGKVHTSLASRFSIRRIIATSMNASLLCTSRS